jgi:hypothetical protein
MERFFGLAISSDPGYVGMITANSFMKRQFGKKLIEEYIPRWDLTHVIDTSGAHIPGHGTPTVILFGRNCRPVADTIRAVMGIRGEPKTPDDPARGLVWSAILVQTDQPGSQSEFVSAVDTPRESFHQHPWSIGGGGAAELKELLEDRAERRLNDSIESIGFMAITGEDEAYVGPPRFWQRSRVPSRPFGGGDAVRDWGVRSDDDVAFMYDAKHSDVPVLDLSSLGTLQRILWPLRTNLKRRLMFGKYPEDSGLTWYEYRFSSRDRLRTPLSIAYAEVATHNHFVLNRSGKVFNQTAPVIKLPSDASEDDHLALLGCLNSSVGCFWMKQTLHSKGGGGINEGLRGEKWEFFYQLSGTGLGRFPVAQGGPLALCRVLELLARDLNEQCPASVSSRGVPTAAVLRQARLDFGRLRAQMVAL